ncbi:MAG: hypothetical protein AB7O59_17825 [Pirellulales bacterium]
MSRPIAVCLLTVIATVVAAPLPAAVIPPIGLAPGASYQLIFVTADIHDALSDDIAIYNAFVTTEAALGTPSGLPTATWTAVASTAAVDANVNAPSGLLPVYNTAGQQVAGPGVGIYTGTLDNLVAYDQHGDVALSAQDFDVWTGSDFQGFGVPDATMGALTNETEIGHVALDSTWLQFDIHLQTSEILFRKPLYALSSTLTVPEIPEPATITLLGTALAMLVGRGIWRRRRT